MTPIASAPMSSGGLAELAAREANALGQLVGPRTLGLAVAAVLAGWLSYVVLRHGVRRLWGLGADPRRRLELLLTFWRLAVVAGLAYWAFRASFARAPTLTVAFGAAVMLTALAALAGKIRDLYAGLLFALRRRMHVGDRVQLPQHGGVVRRIGWTSVELAGDDGSAVLVPSRLFEEQGLTVQSAKSTVVVAVRVAVGANDRPGAVARMRRTALLSPYRVPGTDVAVALDPASGIATVEIHVWAQPAATVAAAHLDAALSSPER